MFAAAAILLHLPSPLHVGNLLPKSGRGPGQAKTRTGPDRDRSLLAVGPVPGQMACARTKEEPGETPCKMQFIALHATIGGAL